METDAPRIGSLCSGIGGLERGLERAGLGHTVWHAEIDPHASQVLASHWDVPNLGSVKQPFRDAPPVDLICAGYPCQPFSQAGRRKGTEDERHLWPAVRDAIRDVGPRLVVLENVRGHLSLGFGEVLGDLADLGFDAEWGLLRASDVGAPHRRERVFIVAYPHGEAGRFPRGAGQAVPEPGTVERPGRRGRRADEGDASTDPDTDTDTEHHGEPFAGWVPERQPRVDAGGRVLDWGPYAAAVHRWEHLTRPAPPPTIDGRLSPRFVEWMQGFPEGWVDGLSRTAALRCLGNAVVPQVAELLGRMILGAGGGAVSPVDTLLPTPTSSHPGGSLEGYHGRFKDGPRSFAPLNMLVEQVLPRS